MPSRVTAWSLSAAIYCKFSAKLCYPFLTTHLSGSPIIQDGRLIGAVTHVTANASTAGYGIFILLASFAA